MAIMRPRMVDLHAQAGAEGFDAMGVPILREKPVDYPTLVPDNPWRAAREERQWVHLHWNPQILAEMVNLQGQMIGNALYSLPDSSVAKEKPWPVDVQYMGTWIDHNMDVIVQRYCHPEFPQVQVGAVIPVARVWFPTHTVDIVK